MTDKATSDLWWKNAVIYCADVATWLDSDGDGTGDLAGLTRRLDYLRGLGINTLWLMPFYPSPLEDDGYDITDYYAVDPRLGTLGDFVEMIRTADNLGIRVLVDLVMSHTSDQHPWFQRSRHARDSRYRDYYRWSDTKQEEPSEVAFPGEQTSTLASLIFISAPRARPAPYPGSGLFSTRHPRSTAFHQLLNFRQRCHCGIAGSRHCQRAVRCTAFNRPLRVASG